MEHRNIDAHYVFLVCFQINRLFGAASAVFNACSDIPALAMTKFTFALRMPASTFLAQRHIFPDQIQELAHQLIRLSFSSLCPAWLSPASFSAS